MTQIRSIATLAALFLAACSGGTGPAATATTATSGSALPATASENRTAKPNPTPHGLPANAIRVQQVDIMDRNGFEKPLPASTGLIPVGWQIQGGVQWGQQYLCTNGYNVNWSARSPDGEQTIAVLPQERWETNNYGAPPSTPGCGSASFSSSQQYLTQRVGRLRPGARVLNYRPRPDLAKKFAYLNASTPTAMGGMRTWVDAGQVQFSYSEGGREMEGVIAASTIFSMSRMSGMGMGSMDALTGFTLPAFAAMAPKGKLNLKLVEAIRQSFLPNPEWEARISQHNTAISRVAQQETAKRSRIVAQTNDYISRIRRETADFKDRSDEHNSREFGEVIRGTEHYDDASAPGGQVELSGYYDHAWRLNDGTYVLSNDAGFDPWKDLGVQGQRLEATK